jgi:hypothetical protein
MNRRFKMFCSIHKWFISRALDSGKQIPGPVDRHLRRCTSCQEFVQFCESLKHRCVQDKPDFLKIQNESLKEKILSSLDEAPTRSVSARKPLLVPILAAASLLLVISISIIWLTAPDSSQLLPVNQLFESNLAQTSIEDTLIKIESPLEEEIVELRETMKSTTEFLLACLDPNIGGEAD